MIRRRTTPALKLFDPSAAAACAHTVSAGGGLARQVRVQCRAPGGRAWQVERVFARLSDAQAFLAARPSDGRDVRIVSCGISPAAA